MKAVLCQLPISRGADQAGEDAQPLVGDRCGELLRGFKAAVDCSVLDWPKGS